METADPPGQATVTSEVRSGWRPASQAASEVRSTSTPATALRVPPGVGSATESARAGTPVAGTPPGPPEAATEPAEQRDDAVRAAGRPSGTAAERARTAPSRRIQP